MATGIELEGAYRNTSESHDLWWYGGGNAYYSNISSALSTVPIIKRSSVTVGILNSETGEVEEWHWPDPSNLTDEGLVRKASANLSSRTFFKNEEGTTYAKTEKDIIIEDTGSIILDLPFMGNVILTKQVDIRGVYGANTDDKEFKLLNRSGKTSIIKANDSETGNYSFDIEEDIDFEDGDELVWKSQSGKWVLSQNTGEVAFSDRLDAVGARMTIDPDGLELISNVQNRYTGHPENFKEIQFTPSIVDGNIFKQIGSKYLKRVFTTPIDLETVGIKYNDESSATSNHDKMVVLLNLFQPICVKDKLYVTPGDLNVTASKILIYGDNDNSEVILGSGHFLTIPDEMDSIVFHDIKLTAPVGTTRWIFRKENIDFTANLVYIKDIIATGDIRIGIVGKTDNLNSKVNRIETLDSVFNDPKRFFQTTNCLFDIFNVERNKVYNFLDSFVYTSINNSHSNPAAVKRGMKLLRVIGNEVKNDENTFETNPTGLYHAFVLTEAYESHYLNNHVEGIKAVVPKELYDIYQSSPISVYMNNTYRNNMCFPGGPSGGLGTLYKGKGGFYKSIKNNQFVIEKAFLEDFISNHLEYSLTIDTCKVSYANFESNPKKVYYEDNIIDVYHLRNEGANNSRDHEFHVNRNTFTCNKIDSVPFLSVGMDTSVGTDRHYSFEGNKIFKRGDEDSEIVQIIDQFNASDPALPVDFISVKINNNYTKGFNVRGVFGTRFSEMELGNNTFDVSGVTGDISTLIDQVLWYGSISGSNNLFISDRVVRDFRRGTRLRNVNLSTEYRLSQSRIDVSSGYYIHATDYNYSLTRTYEISNSVFSDLTVSIYIDHVYDGTDSFINYTSYEDDADYSVKIESTMNMGNGGSSHILLNLNDKTGTKYGDIRIYANSGIPRLSISIPDSNYKIKITDNVQD